MVVDRIPAVQCLVVDQPKRGTHLTFYFFLPLHANISLGRGRKYFSLSFKLHKHINTAVSTAVLGLTENSITT